MANSDMDEEVQNTSERVALPSEKTAPSTLPALAPSVVRLLITLLVLVLLCVVFFTTGLWIAGVLFAVLSVALVAVVCVMGNLVVNGMLKRGSNAFRGSQEFEDNVAQAIRKLQGKSELLDQEPTDVNEGISCIDDVVGSGLLEDCPSDAAFMSNMDDDERERVVESRLEERALTYDWLCSQRPWEEVATTSDDGTELRAHLLACAPDSNRWVILAHGYAGSWNEMLVHARAYGQHGYNILSCDMRAHGTSGGDYVGLGLLDASDLVAWARFLINRSTYSNPDCRIVLHGHSMGASSVLGACSLEKLPQQVMACVSDCSFVSGWESVSRLWASMSPDLPLHPSLDLARLNLSLRRGGYDFCKANPIEWAANLRVPLFVIHGNKDTFVDVEDARLLYNAAPGKKQLVIVEGAGHCLSSFADPTAYYSNLFEFLDECVG